MRRPKQGWKTRGHRVESRCRVEVSGVLTRKRTDLTRLIGGQIEDRLHGGNPAHVGAIGDEGEAAARALLADVESDAMDRRVQMVRQVDLALRRLAEGVYGSCVDCGEEIRMERLRSLPFALRCRNCQESWEASEGRSTRPRPLAGGPLPIRGREQALSLQDLRRDLESEWPD
jgi:RNA polymerase-binding transcription factor DksA